jgi:hypothetical protein
VSNPELAGQWCPENGNMADYSRGSGTIVSWLCPGKEQHKYRCSIKNRTGPKPTNCRECFNDSRRIHDKKQMADLHASNRVVKDSVAIGDAVENYFADELRALNYYPKIVVIGAKADKTDVIVTLPDTGQDKSIQARSLIKRAKLVDSYKMTNDTVFNDKMLILMVNAQRDRFALEFYGNIKRITDLALPFNSTTSKYRSIMFTDKALFMAEVKKLLPSAVDFTPNMSEDSAKEDAMFGRIEAECIKNNWVYARNTTNGNTVDFSINGIKNQGKFHSKNSPGSLTYSVNAYKMGGKLNGKATKKPYSFNDPFENIIVEVGGTEKEPNKYLGNFCVLTKTILMEQGILSTQSPDGKTIGGQKSMGICPPDYPKSHWSKKCWNNFAPFLQTPPTPSTLSN